MKSTPRIKVVGEHGMEELPRDDLPESNIATELGDYFRPVKLSPHSIDDASKIVPMEIWFCEGLHCAKREV